MHRLECRNASARLLLGAIAFVPGAALAQVPPAAPNAIPTRDQLQIPQGDAAPPPATAKVESGGALAASSCPLSESTVRVTISHIRFSAVGGAGLPDPLGALLAQVAAPAGEARAVVATFWQVPAGVQSDELIRAFYAAGRTGEIGAALRAAQAELIRQPAYSHPFHWGAYFVVGDGSKRMLASRPPPRG